MLGVEAFRDVDAADAERPGQVLHERAEERRAGDRGRAVVALLVPVALLNYLDRQMLASMKFSVMRDIPDIGLEANWGAILALFKWVYAFLSPIGGYLADRYSRRHVIAGSLFVWSLRDVGDRARHHLRSAALTRALMGISEAFYIPAALALIADFHTGPHAIARGRPPPDGDLRRRDHRRLRRLCGRSPGARLALGVRACAA